MYPILYPPSSQKTSVFSTSTVAPCFIMENILKISVPVITDYSRLVKHSICISCSIKLQNVYKFTVIINKLMVSLIRCLSPTSIIGKMFYATKFESGSLITISAQAGDKESTKNTVMQEAAAQSEHLVLEAVSEGQDQSTSAEVDDRGRCTQVAGNKELKRNSGIEEAQGQSQQLVLEAVSRGLAETETAEVDDGGSFPSTESYVSEASATVSKVSIKIIILFCHFCFKLVHIDYTQNAKD